MTKIKARKRKRKGGVSRRDLFLISAKYFSLVLLVSGALLGVFFWNFDSIQFDSIQFDFFPPSLEEKQQLALASKVFQLHDHSAAYALRLYSDCSTRFKPISTSLPLLLRLENEIEKVTPLYSPDSDPVLRAQNSLLKAIGKYRISVRFASEKVYDLQLRALSLEKTSVDGLTFIRDAAETMRQRPATSPILLQDIGTYLDVLIDITMEMIDEASEVRKVIRATQEETHDLMRQASVLTRTITQSNTEKKSPSPVFQGIIALIVAIAALFTPAGVIGALAAVGGGALWALESEKHVQRKLTEMNSKIELSEMVKGGLIVMDTNLALLVSEVTHFRNELEAHRRKYQRAEPLLILRTNCLISWKCRAAKWIRRFLNGLKLFNKWRVEGLKLLILNFKITLFLPLNSIQPHKVSLNQKVSLLFFFIFLNTL